MASSKQPLGSNQFSEKEKAAIDEAVKEAQSILANSIKNAKASQDQVALVTGVMKNLQGRGLKLNKSHVWKGKFLTGPPETIGESGAFVHEGDAAQVGIPMAEGSKAVVIYGHYDDDAVSHLGWLLAWDKSTLFTNKFDKVYVEAGYLSRLMSMEMSEIEKKLDASHAASRYWDSDTGAAAAAQMASYANNMVLVGATFDKM